MKKTTAFLALFFVLFQLSAQKALDWKKIDSPKDDYVFKYFYQYTGDVYKGIFTIPTVKPFQSVKNQIFVRTFNADLSSYTEQGIPSESPYLVSVTGFKDYTVIYGSTDENKNPMLQYHADNKLLVTDAQLNILLNVSYSVHGKKHRFTDTPSVYRSCDSTHLIVINSEIMAPDKPSFKASPTVQFISVYDKDLQLVWKDSVDFEQIFGKDVPLNNFDMDFMNNKLYVFASHRAVPTKKLKPTLYIIRYDHPQSYQVVDKEIFPNDYFSWKYLLNKKGEMYMCGINEVLNSSKNKQLFYMSLDLNAPDAKPLLKTYTIDKAFIAKYPDYKFILANYLTYPGSLLLTADGLIYCSEYHAIVTSSSKYSSSTSYYFKPMTFIKFDLDGNIVWLKMIDKNVQSSYKYSEYFCRAFYINNEVVVFYYDFVNNIFAEAHKGKPTSPFGNKLCLALARIDADGNIVKKVITAVGDDGTSADLNRLRQISDTRFFMTGSGINLKTRGDYVTFYDLKEKE